jgi:tetratricopeptide (TPR) repeat protein
MKRVAFVAVFAAAAVLCAIRLGNAQSAVVSSPQNSTDASPPSAAQTSPVPTQPALSQTPPPADVQAKLRECVDALKLGDYTRSLALARELIAVDDNNRLAYNSLAYNLAGASSLGLKDYPAAIASFKQALQTQPTWLHDLDGLMKAYRLAGMTQERDAERDTLRQMSRDGWLPRDFHYVFDAFDYGDKKVEVTEFPQLAGKFNFRYHFNVYDAEGKFLYRVALESDDLDQGGLVPRDPALAAKGRRFSLDGYKANDHFTYGFFDGEPPYEEVRKEVLDILAGTKRALTSSHHASKPGTGSTPQNGAGGASTPPKP